jgi:tRNA (guanine37-N1)-methyltransferase
VLLSGHHREIEQWRRLEALRATWEKRPDLLSGVTLSPEEERELERLRAAGGPGPRSDLPDRR